MNLYPRDKPQVFDVLFASTLSHKCSPAFGETIKTLIHSNNMLAIMPYTENGGQ